MHSDKKRICNDNIYLFIFGSIFILCDRLKLQSCVCVGQTKERFCPEGLSGRENIDREQLHFGGVIAFHTCVIQTAVAKYNNCKPTAISTVALLFCTGQHIPLVVFTFQFILLECFLQIDGVRLQEPGKKKRKYLLFR